MAIILVFWRLRKFNHVLKSSLGYIVRLGLKDKTATTKTWLIYTQRKSSQAFSLKHKLLSFKANIKRNSPGTEKQALNDLIQMRFISFTPRTKWWLLGAAGDGRDG